MGGVKWGTDDVENFHHLLCCTTKTAFLNQGLFTYLAGEA